MTETMFPTFSKWLTPLGDVRHGHWRLRGPTWYISTWIGDSLAAQQQSLLRVLAVGFKERINLAPVVQCLAEEHRGRYRRLLKRLAFRLQAGVSLVDALEQTPDALDDDAVLALRFGSQTGTLQTAFEMLLSREKTNEYETQNHLKQEWVYWVVLACTIGFVLLLMMALIAPTFKAMFDEFGLRLPASLETLITICNIFANYAALWILLVVVLVGLAWSSAVRRFLRRKIAPLFMQPIAQMRRAELLKLLALGVDSGRPISGALSTLARYHFDSRVRQRLLYARNEIEQGVEAWQGLIKADLLTEQQSLAVANAPSNEIRAWILRRLASGMHIAAQQRTSIGFALLQPVVVLTFGAIVMFVFVSFFSVLILMITSLS